MTSRLRRIGVRVGMVYGALVLVMHPGMIGLHGTDIYSVMAWLTGLTMRRVGLGDYPMQGEFVFRLVASVAAGLAWWLLDRNHRDEDFLFDLLQVELRYVVGASLIASGLGQLLAVTTPMPSQADWIRPIREFTQQHYMITWIGTSPFHKTAEGSAELLAGICLLFRNTATFGAFFAVGILGNLVMTRIGFDNIRAGSYWIPAELAAMASVQLLVDARRLIVAIAYEHRPVQRRAPVVWPAGWPQHMSRYALPIVVIVLVLGNLHTLLHAYNARHHSALAGVYEVERYKLNGRDSLSAEEATARWRLVAIDDCERFAIRTIDDRQLEATVVLPDAGTFSRHRACARATAAATGTFTVARPDSLPPATFAFPPGSLRYTRAANGDLDLEAKVGNASIAAHLRRIPDSAFQVFRPFGNGM